MSLAGRKVLVTGADGFIGSHLAERLVAEGARVRGLVWYNSFGRAGWLDDSDVRGDIEIVAGDITDADSMRDAVAGTEVVFHLAALIAIPYSYAAPRSYLRTNAEGTLNVLQAARDADVTRLVHTSTSEVYGTARQVPITEEHPLQGQSPYAASKIAADKMAEAFHLSFDLPVVTVRPFNTYGPRQSARAIIPTIITQVLRGNSVRLGNLHPTRDLTFVADTVDGMVRAAVADGAEGSTINLGTGHEISIGDLAAAIGRMMKTPLEPEIEGRRVRPPASEVERLCADAGRAAEMLGWRAEVDLERGLEATIAWIGENLDRYHQDGYVL